MCTTVYACLCTQVKGWQWSSSSIPLCLTSLRQDTYSLTEPETVFQLHWMVNKSLGSSCAATLVLPCWGYRHIPSGFSGFYVYRCLGFKVRSSCLCRPKWATFPALVLKTEYTHFALCMPLVHAIPINASWNTSERLKTYS